MNEEENITPLVAQIIACGVPFLEILFVDDHSTDATRQKIRALQGSRPIRLLEQDGADIGLASAIMSGARAAQGEILLVMDADLSHPPERIKDLLAPLFAGGADFGSWEPVCERRTHTWLANVAPDHVASRCRARLPAYRPARFDVRVFRHWPFSAD